jgi:hypothetical protein
MKLVRVIGCASRGRSIGEWHSSPHRQMLELNSDKWSNVISGVQKDYIVALVYESD